jgi:hypothetical protein
MIGAARCSNLGTLPTLRVDTLIGIARRPLSLDILDVFEGFQITIEVPFEFAQRDQLLGFMESKFPGAEFSIVHRDVSHPTVSEVLVQHDSAVEVEEDSEAVLLKATDALSAFTKAPE